MKAIAAGAAGQRAVAPRDGATAWCGTTFGSRPVRHGRRAGSAYAEGRAGGLRADNSLAGGRWGPHAWLATGLVAVSIR